jgi:hypothetical protein
LNEVLNKNERVKGLNERIKNLEKQLESDNDNRQRLVSQGVFVDMKSRSQNAGRGVRAQDMNSFTR